MLDLNGYKLSSSANPAIQSGASLTIIDTGSDGSITSDGSTVISLAGGSKKLTINGGKIEATNGSAVSAANAATTEIVMTGGEVFGTSYGFGLKNCPMTVTGGKIIGNSKGISFNRDGGPVTIGRENGSHNDVRISSIQAPKNSPLTLNSGTIDDPSAIKSAASLKIPSSAWNGDVLRFGKELTIGVPSGAVCIEVSNGTESYFCLNSAKQEDQVARIGDDYYSSLSTAIQALKENKTLVLLKDVSEDITISQKNVTLDLNGRTVTASVTISQKDGTGANTVSIQNGTVTGNISANQNKTGPVTLELALSTPPQKVSLLTNARMAAKNIALLDNGGFKITESDGDYLYGRFSSAVSHANGSVITLVNDYNGKDELSLYENQTAVLDLGGHTYTVNGAAALYQTEPNADITVRNGTLKSVNNPKQYAVYSQADNVSMTFENVKMPSDAEYTLGVNGTVKNNDIALKDCVITGKKAAVYLPSSQSHLEIRDTTISGGDLGLAVKGGTVDIYGTKTKISASAALKKPTAYYPGSTGQEGFTASGYAVYVEGGYDWPIYVNIHGGVFTSDGDAVFKYVQQAEAYAREITIDGGLFSSEPKKDDLAKGFGAKKTKRGYIVGQNVVVNEQGEVIGGSFVDDPREYGVVADVGRVNQDNHMHIVSVPSTANLPKTGDQTPLPLLAALTAACGAAALVLAGKRRKG